MMVMAGRRSTTRHVDTLALRAAMNTGCHILICATTQDRGDHIKKLVEVRCTELSIPLPKLTVWISKEKG